MCNTLGIIYKKFKYIGILQKTVGYRRHFLNLQLPGTCKVIDYIYEEKT